MTIQEEADFGFEYYDEVGDDDSMIEMNRNQEISIESPRSPLNANYKT